MDLTKAKEIQEHLTSKYLFANILTPALAFHDNAWNSREDALSERLLQNFEKIEALAISKEENGEYSLQVFNTSEIPYPKKFLTYFGITADDIHYRPVKTFRVQSRIRPLAIGCSIGHVDVHKKGTLGCFVTDRSGNHFLLSCYHVLNNPSASYGNDFIIQPSRLDGGVEADSIGLFHKGIPLNEFEENYFDAGLAGPLSEAIDPVISSVIPPSGIKGLSEAQVNAPVFKCGAGSNLTTGKILSTAFNGKIYQRGKVYAIRNQVLIESTDDNGQAAATPFSVPGDSGAVVLSSDNHHGVGLVIGGDQNLSLANPLDRVLDELHVELLCG